MVLDNAIATTIDIIVGRTIIIIAITILICEGHISTVIIIILLLLLGPATTIISIISVVIVILIVIVTHWVWRGYASDNILTRITKLVKLNLVILVQAIPPVLAHASLHIAIIRF